MRLAIDYVRTGRPSLALCFTGCDSNTLGEEEEGREEGYQPSILTLIWNKWVRGEPEVVIWSVVLKTMSGVK